MSNSTSRLADLYQRWAGEFVVIVLGILAALAVDSWSEDRANRQLEREYLARITEDLRWDLQDIEVAIETSILQARSATTILIELDDPLAKIIPNHSDRLDAIDFLAPTHEENDVKFGHLVWWLIRDRTFAPRSGTYDELLATGRIVVIDNASLRARINDHYALVDGEIMGFSDWVEGSGDEVDKLVRESGFNAFDFQYLDDSLPLLRDIDELPALVRNVRRITLRQVFVLDLIENSSRELLAEIDAFTK